MTQNADYEGTPLVVARHEGRYIDEHGRGCRTCGWYIPNDADPSDQHWLNHEHDPIRDITERVLSGVTYVPSEDVIYLLEAIDALSPSGRSGT